MDWWMRSWLQHHYCPTALAFTRYWLCVANRYLWLQLLSLWNIGKSLCGEYCFMSYRTIDVVPGHFQRKPNLYSIHFTEFVGILPFYVYLLKLFRLNFYCVFSRTCSLRQGWIFSIIIQNIFNIHVVHNLNSNCLLIIIKRRPYCLYKFYENTMGFSLFGLINLIIFPIWPL